MGIVLTPSVSTLETQAYIAFRKEFEIIAHAVDSTANCIVDLFNCERPMPQFIDLVDPDDNDINDFKTFVYDVGSGGTITSVLKDCKTDTEVNITDNTFGFLTDLGGFPLRLLTWGFRVDWHSVHGTFGFGEFIFTNTVKDSAGVAQLEECFRFKLMPFNCDLAHGTIRFETHQIGHIHNGFDYRNLFVTTLQGGLPQLTKGWKDQIRWYGRMWLDNPNEENDFFQTSNRINEPIQQKETDNFKVLLKFIRQNWGEYLRKDLFLAHEILISDYNQSGYRTYRNQRAWKASTDNIDEKKLQTGINLEFTFTENDEGTVNREHG